MNGVQRSRLLVLLLGATLMALYFAPSSERRDQTPTPPVDGRQTGPVAQDVLVLSIRPRGADEESSVGVFGADLALPASIQPSAGTTTNVSPPPHAPPPQAPPLPFRLLGSYVEDDRRAVFLQHNERTLLVRVGDNVAGQYQIEGFDGSTLYIRYLPLNQQQTLALGSTN